jgi:hypothetical protein
VIPVVFVITNNQKINSNARNPAREAGITIIEKTNVVGQTEAREVGET